MRRRNRHVGFSNKSRIDLRPCCGGPIEQIQRLRRVVARVVAVVSRNQLRNGARRFADCDRRIPVGDSRRTARRRINLEVTLVIRREVRETS
jgi:hypothetical protein